jgi:DNA-binding NarL/FixJ family response regulator
LPEPHFDVVGIVADGRELLSAASALRPDAIVVGISMPSLNGIEAAGSSSSTSCESRPGAT